MIFLANLNSFHIKTWFDIYGANKLTIADVFSVHKQSNDIQLPFRRIFFLSKILSYVLLGVYLRFKVDKRETVHAHGASGYGLSALLSGRRYILTIYGSELLAAHSAPYRLMMKLILQRASLITVTSSVAEQALIAKHQISPTKIANFHTGIDVKELAEIKQSVKNVDTPIQLLSIRNCAPHYQSEMIIRAFNECKKHCRSRIQLTVIEGNGDNNYFKDLQAKYASDDIQFIAGLVTKQQMLSLIANSDICINAPLTDQLSTSLLEATYYNRVLVSNKLAAYQPLIDLYHTVKNEYLLLAKDDKTLLSQLNVAIESTERYRQERHQLGTTLIKSHYSIEKAAQAFSNALLNTNLVNIGRG